MDRLEIRKQLKAEREAARIKDQNPMTDMCNKIKTEIIAEYDADIIWALNSLESGNENTNFGP